MTTHSSSIDDLLSGIGSVPQPEPESEIEPEIATPIEPSTESYDADESESSTESESEHEYTDEYGNESPAPRMYTEDEVNERINKAVRDRLARRREEQPTQQQMQQAQQSGFEYDPDSNASWQQQLESFVEQTVTRMSQKQAQKQIQEREAQAQAEFEMRFQEGMGKFADFVEVVSAQPITDAMTIATRGMKDPAAFVYAASKRHPAELQRIANIQDPYTQILEIGRLEERMKKAKAATQAPRPVGRTAEDSQTQHKTTKEPTIEELIAQSEARKRAQFVQRAKR